MKKFINGSIVFIVVFAFLFSNGYSQIPRKLVTKSSVVKAVYLKGWVKYTKTYTKSYQILGKISSGLICKLPGNSIYRIHSIKLNNIKYGPPHNHVFEIPANTGFGCSVGQLLEIKLGLIKKSIIPNIRQKPVFHTIAKFKINNLFRTHAFPEPNQEIDPNADNLSYYLFRWKFTNFTEKTNLGMSALSQPSVSFSALRGERIKIEKSRLNPGSEYLLYHYTLFSNAKNKFTMVKPGTTSDSQVTFTFNVKQYFKVKAD